MLVIAAIVAALAIPEAATPASSRGVVATAAPVSAPTSKMIKLTRGGYLRVEVWRPHEPGSQNNSGTQGRT